MEPYRGVRRTLRGLAFVIVLVGAVTVACSSAPAESAPRASTTAASSPGLTVGDAWARPTLVGGDSAAYLTITNSGAADTLLSIECTIASSTMLHQTSTDSTGMTGMSMLADLPIPSGATVRLAPGGTHVMIAGLERPLTVGEKVELRLVFAHAGEIVVPAAIQPG
jgi:periplasmic copper chaperone A